MKFLFLNYRNFGTGKTFSNLEDKIQNLKNEAERTTESLVTGRFMSLENQEDFKIAMKVLLNEIWPISYGM